LLEAEKAPRAALDVLTITMIGSGLYLWLARRKRAPPRADAFAKRAPPSLDTASSGPSRLWIGLFAAPILLAAVTITGLLAALLWGPVGRYVGWVTVGAPVLVVIWTFLPRGLDKVSFQKSGPHGRARVG